MVPFLLLLNKPAETFDFCLEKVSTSSSKSCANPDHPFWVHSLLIGETKELSAPWHSSCNYSRDKVCSKGWVYCGAG